MQERATRIGERLRMFRRAANLTQEQLGAVLGLSGPTITNYESGRSQINADDLPRVAAAMGIDPCLFYADDEQVRNACGELAARYWTSGQAAIVQEEFNFDAIPVSPFGTTVQRALAYDRQPWLFIGARGGPMGETEFWKLVREWGLRADIWNVRSSPHTLRHTGAVRFLQAHPGHIAQLKARLGHETLDMTLRYSQRAEEEQTVAGPSAIARIGLSGG